jgi:ribonuclease T2
MNKVFLISILFVLNLDARYKAVPTRSCPAFNNMKHSKNSNLVHLDTTKQYTVLREHKGQKLVLVKGEQPVQRWVDAECLSSFNANSKIDNNEAISKHTKKYEDSKAIENNSNKNLLALSWHNAFCETHRSKKECKRNVTSLFRSKKHERNFILHGLWPQPKNRAYCAVDRKYITMDKYRHWNKLPNLGLSAKTKEKLTKIMPGVHSNLHKHEWFKHGTCYGTNAEKYFRDAISLVEQFHNSKVSEFFEKNIGKRVTLQQVRKKFDDSFGLGTGKRVELRCKNGLITELWLHLGSKSNDLGTLLKKGKSTRSRCQRGLVDKAGYGR